LTSRSFSIKYFMTGFDRMGATAKLYQPSDIRLVVFSVLIGYNTESKVGNSFPL
jgi:hypothetical protein